MNQFRKKGYAPYLDVFPPFKTSATTHAASPTIKQTFSLSPSLSLPTCPDPDKNISL